MFINRPGPSSLIRACFTQFKLRHHSLITLPVSPDYYIYQINSEVFTLSIHFLQIKKYHLNLSQTMAYEGHSFGYSADTKTSDYQPYYNYGYQTHLDYYYGYPSTTSYYPYSYGSVSHGRGDEIGTSSRSSSPESYTGWNSTNISSTSDRAGTPLGFADTYLDVTTSPSSKADYFSDIKVDSTVTPLEAVSATLPLTPPVSPPQSDALSSTATTPDIKSEFTTTSPDSAEPKEAGAVDQQAFIDVSLCYSQPDVTTSFTNPLPQADGDYPSHSAPNIIFPQEPTTRRTVKANRRGTTRNNPLPSSATDVMNAWFTSHPDHPYPTQDEKDSMIQVTGITLKQLNHWFNNRRSRSASTAPKRQKRKLEQQLASLCFDLSVSHEAGSVAEKLTSVIQYSLAPAIKRRR